MDEDFSWSGGGQIELVVLVYIRNLLEMGRKSDGESHVGPMSLSSVCTNFAECRAVDYCCNVGHAINLHALEQVLEEPEAPAGLNLVCPTTRQEYVMLVCHPAMILHMRKSIIALFLF